MNVPHAFVKHPDMMSPTGAPWAKPQEQAVQLDKSVPDTISAHAAFPGVAVDQQGQLKSGRPFSSSKKRITCIADLKVFIQSKIIKEFVGFILVINDACTGKKLSAMAQHASPAVQSLLNLLDTLGTWVTEIPPVEQSLRYGNPAFRTWHGKLVSEAEGLLHCILPDNLKQAAVTLAPYLCDSFGNATRIDYGTGHETTFVAFLFCLARLGVLTEQDCASLVGGVFSKYITLMRRIQTTYWLEPAGSHGVWGLDDYQFIPFIWGSAQLIQNPMIKPKSIHNDDVLNTYANEFLYLAAVQFVKQDQPLEGSCEHASLAASFLLDVRSSVNAFIDLVLDLQVKKGPLQETSPMICDISAVPTWLKVNSGMMKMYQVEVLSKLPIMQHFFFGDLIPFPDAGQAST